MTYTEDEREIIVAASLEAQNGIPDELGIELLIPHYRRRRDNLFADKRWVFLLDYYERSQLKETTTDRNILMPYKYTLPSLDVQDVLDVNINSMNQYQYLSIEQGLKVGLEIFPENGIATQIFPEFTYIDKVLYCSQPVENVIVKKQVQEKDLDPETRHLLVLEMAVFIAKKDQRGVDTVREIKQERRNQYAKASYRTVRKSRNPYGRLILDWYKKFYNSTSYY